MVGPFPCIPENAGFTSLYFVLFVVVVVIGFQKTQKSVKAFA